MHTPLRPSLAHLVLVQLVLVLVEDVLHNKALFKEELVAEGTAPPAGPRTREEQAQAVSHKADC